MGPTNLPETAGRLNPQGYFTLPLLQREGFFHFFGTRTLHLAEALKGSPSSMLRQMHGDTIVTLSVDRGESERPPPERDEASPESFSPVRSVGVGDAIITDRPSEIMAVATADCFPILLISEDYPAVAVLHAGWRGTLLNLSAKVVAAMTRAYPIQPASLWAGIGPGIGRCCFEVGPEVWEEIKNRYPYGESVIGEPREDKAKVDLALLNRLQLLDAGLPLSHMAEINLCTACHATLFYSYRRDKSKTRNLASGVMRTRGMHEHKGNG